jgi:hypothetical protein
MFEVFSRAPRAPRTEPFPEDVVVAVLPGEALALTVLVLVIELMLLVFEPDLIALSVAEKLVTDMPPGGALTPLFTSSLLIVFPKLVGLAWITDIPR